ncbi:MAG: peptidylprolyl isomerase [Ignavibacteriaceae bacterium]|nr:peptidylprolyl isomerase [Ignavibacteriaceae bacterium]
MRSLAPAFILSVGALFVLFMVLSDSKLMEIFGAHGNNVGSVNGQDITYQEFVKAVDQQKENQKKQTGQDIDEDNMDQFRDQVWDAVVNQTLVEEQIKKFGITVSDDEVKDIILGDNPPQILKQNFMDSTGKFNRQAYDQAIMDPRNKAPLIQAEEYVKQTRLSEKLQSLLLASINVGENEIRKRFMDQNINLNAQYALVDINQFPDADFKINDEDLKKYYDNNLIKYHIDAQRKLKYVNFPFIASSDDSSIIKRNLETIVTKMKKYDTLSLKSAVEMYSSYPYSKDSMNISQIPPTAIDKFMNSAPGSIIGPVASNEGMALYKLDNIVTGSAEFVKASHILINQGDDATRLAEAQKIYDQIKAGASFEQLAKEKSGDKSNADKGGELGWFGKGSMVPDFEKACFEGKVGEILKPVKTPYGYHVIKITGKSDKRFVVEKIIAPVKPSASTKDSKLSLAQDYAFVADKNGMEKEANLMKYNILETTPFVKDAVSIPGIGQSKRLVDWAFDNSKGKVSEPFKMQSGYVVVMVSDVIPEGTRPFDEVKNLIKPEVVKAKKYAKAKDIIESVVGKLNGNLSMANALNNKITVDTTGNFNLAGGVPKVGRDFAFMDKASSLDVNKISEPVKGIRGYYLIKLISKSAFDNSAYQAQRNQIRDNILQEKKSSFFNQWLTKIKKDAKIVDNRYKVFGQ